MYISMETTVIKTRYIVRIWEHPIETHVQQNVASRILTDFKNTLNRVIACLYGFVWTTYFYYYIENISQIY